MMAFLMWYLALGAVALAALLWPMQAAYSDVQLAGGRGLESVSLRQALQTLRGGSGPFGLVLTAALGLLLWPAAFVWLRRRHSTARSFSESLAKVAADQRAKPGRASPQWLVRQVSAQEVTQALGERARTLLEPCRPGDELWIYSTPKDMWDKNDGTEWMVLIRSGYILAHVVTRRS
jgi:hypothetical protein